MCFNKKYLIFAVCFLLFIAFELPVFAVPVQFLTNSYLAGNAFSGATTSPNIATIDSNPAMLAVLTAPEVYLSDSYIHSRTDNDNARASTSLYPSVPGQTASSSATSAHAPSFFIAWPNSSPVAFGVAITAGWGLNSEYADDWVGRYLNTELKLKTLDITPMMAIKVTPRLSIGVGWHIQKSKFSSKGDSALGWYEESASAWSHGYILGALYQISHKTSVGLSYNHFSSMSFDASGTYHTQVEGQFPDTINLGFRHRLNEKLTVMINVQEILWRQFYLKQQTDVGFAGLTTSSTAGINLKNSHLLSTGIAYSFSQKNTLEFGIGVDDGKFTTSNNRLWLSSGLQHRFSKHCTLGLSYLYGTKQSSLIETKTPVSVSQNGIVVMQGTNTLTMESSNIVQIFALGFHYRF